MGAPSLTAKIQTSRTFGSLKRRFSLGSKKVLDVGSSDGHYLAHFGQGSQGVTIIKEHVERAQAQGLNIVWGNVEDEAFHLDGAFEVLWVNNLLEHLNAPHPFLVRMRDQVGEGGLLILGVPVIPFFSFLTRWRKFRGAYAVSHVNFFTRKTLMETARVAGWNVVEARLFYFENPYLDALMNLIAPHIYVVATVNPDFTYSHKRLLSLAGYGKGR